MENLRIKSFRPFALVSLLIFFTHALVETWAFPHQCDFSFKLSRMEHGDLQVLTEFEKFRLPMKAKFRGHRSTATQLYYASPSIMEVVQGSSLHVVPFSTSRNARSLRIDMMTDGRPLEAQAELWQGPDHCPQKMRVYSENGYERPFRVSMEAPTDAEFAIAIRNTGKTFEFPLTASVQDLHDMEESDANPFYYSELLLEDSDGDDETNGYGNVLSRSNGRTIQGGAMRSFNFPPKVEKIQVLLETIGGLPLCARIEISQGPDNNKQVMDVYSEDGKGFPLYLAIDLPASSASNNGIVEASSSPVSSAEGLGHVMRIINAASMEFPIRVWVDSYTNGPTAAEQQSPRVFDLRRILGAKQNIAEEVPKHQVPRVGDSKTYPTW